MLASNDDSHCSVIAGDHSECGRCGCKRSPLLLGQQAAWNRDRDLTQS